MKLNINRFLVVIIVSLSLIVPHKGANAMLGDSRERLTISVIGLIFALSGVAGTLDAIANRPERLHEGLLSILFGVIVLDEASDKSLPVFKPIDESFANTANLTSDEVIAYNRSVDELNALSETVNSELSHNHTITSKGAAEYWKKSIDLIDIDAKNALMKLLTAY